MVAAFATGVLARGDTNKTASAPNPAATASAIANFDSPQPRSPAPQLSRWTSEIVRLTQSGVDDQVVLAFVKSAGVFNLAAAHIVYLNDLGVSGHVIHAMLIHDRDRFARREQSTNVANISLSSPQPLVIASVDQSSQEETLHAPASVPVPAALSINVANNDPAIQSFNTTAAAQSGTGISRREALNWEKLPRLPAVPTKKKIVYPVREPYPVELTAPIVMLEPPSF